MNYKSFLLPLFAVPLAASLVGCSGQPSAGDIEKAVKANVQQSNQQVKNLGGSAISDNLLTQVHSVKKIGCVEAQGESGFNCDVEIDASVPFVGRSNKVGKFRFVKGDSGWVVAAH